MSYTYPQFHDTREQTFYTPAGDGGAWEEKALCAFDDEMSECKTAADLAGLLEELLYANLTGSLDNKGARASEWAFDTMKELLVAYTDKHMDFIYEWARKGQERGE